MQDSTRLVIAIAAASVHLAPPALGAGPPTAGTIIVAHDEWTLSDAGFAQAPDTALFAVNIAALFTDGGTGSFLVYSSNFGFNGTELADTMTGAGHGWTVDPDGPFDLATLSAYDAVFLGGAPGLPAADVLTAYIESGGHAYICGGSAQLGGAAGEAMTWNPLLQLVDLAFEPFFNGIIGLVDVDSPHPLFAGVGQLFQNSGNGIVALVPDGAGTLIVTDDNGVGLWAIGSNDTGPTCPEDIAEPYGVVDVGDLVAVIAGWGTPAGDVTGDGETSVADLLAIILAWGACG